MNVWNLESEIPPLQIVIGGKYMSLPIASEIHDIKQHKTPTADAEVKGKGSPYSITERRVPELIRYLAVSLEVT